MHRRHRTVHDSRASCCRWVRRSLPRFACTTAIESNPSREQRHSKLTATRSIYTHNCRELEFYKPYVMAQLRQRMERRRRAAPSRTATSNSAIEVALEAASNSLDAFKDRRRIIEQRVLDARSHDDLLYCSIGSSHDETSASSHIDRVEGPVRSLDDLTSRWSWLLRYTFSEALLWRSIHRDSAVQLDATSRSNGSKMSLHYVTNAREVETLRFTQCYTDHPAMAFERLIPIIYGFDDGTLSLIDRSIPFHSID